jgi:hypothetical protein
MGLRLLSLDMTNDRAHGAEAFERSREHRRGVRQACIELEESLARPGGRDLEKWLADVAARCRELTEAFRHHAEQSEGPDGLLQEIVGVAPRLAHAVDQVKREHEALLTEMTGLDAAVSEKDSIDQIGKVREDVLRLLRDVAAHRQRGADLIYEAYSVDVEGGDSG